MLQALQNIETLKEYLSESDLRTVVRMASTIRNTRFLHWKPLPEQAPSCEPNEPNFETIDSAKAFLQGTPEPTRTLIRSVITSGEFGEWIGALADKWVYEATREMTYIEAAAIIGLSFGAVNKRANRYRKENGLDNPRSSK